MNSTRLWRQPVHFKILMSKNILLRLSAVAAIAGGALRVVDGLLITSAAIQTQQFACFLTDLLLMFGLCGIYLTWSNRLGLAGFVGFVLSFTGILMVRSSALSLFGFSTFLTGASVTLLGVVAIGAAMLIRNAFPKLAPTLWIASLIIGVAGFLPVAMSWGVTLAGGTFGIGFIVAVISLLLDKTASLALFQEKPRRVIPACQLCFFGNCPVLR
jgi:hypothetical protein